MEVPLLSSPGACSVLQWLPLPTLLPPPVLAHGSDVMGAAGDRDLVWAKERISSALLKRSGGQAVHQLLPGGARGADQAF
jgi:hypothetical protein